MELDAIAALDEIIRLLLSAELGRKVQGPLLTSLEGAKASFEADRRDVAVNQLQAFQNKARAQLTGVNPDLSAQLIGLTQDIIDAD